MEFFKYNSIESAYRTKEINSIREQGLDHGDWVVQEKVHGGNFSFLSNGNELRVAKRTSFTDGGFYNCQIVIDKYSPNVKSLFEYMKGINSNIEYIQVFGELYGGSYPSIKSDTKAVQKGVFYNPELDFYAFDIRAVSSTGKAEYLDVDDANLLFEKFGFFYAKTIFSGSFTKCLEYTNEYNSTIPALLGLPEVENNICEGNILRPIKVKRFRNGQRVIIKDKNEKWSEKSNKSRTPKVPVEVPEHIQKYVENMSAYITENRLRNVLSKIGPESINQKSFGMISGSFTKDAITDFLKDHTEFEILEKSEKKLVTKQAGKMSAELIRPLFLDIIDGTF